MTTKEKVLAKCGETERMKDSRQPNGSIIFRGDYYWAIHNESKTMRALVTADTPEDDPVWPLAAQILGIGEQPQRPSNDLLRQAFGKGYASYLTPLKEAETIFAEWLSTLPADPLEADRASLADAFTEGLEEDLTRNAYNHEFISSLKRLAGMEVQND